MPGLITFQQTNQVQVCLPACTNGSGERGASRCEIRKQIHQSYLLWVGLKWNKKTCRWGRQFLERWLFGQETVEELANEWSHIPVRTHTRQRIRNYWNHTLYMYSIYISRHCATNWNGIEMEKKPHFNSVLTVKILNRQKLIDIMHKLLMFHSVCFREKSLILGLLYDASNMKPRIGPSARVPF